MSYAYGYILSYSFINFIFSCTQEECSVRFLGVRYTRFVRGLVQFYVHCQHKRVKCVGAYPLRVTDIGACVRACVRAW